MPPLTCKQGVEFIPAEYSPVQTYAGDDWCVKIVFNVHQHDAFVFKPNAIQALYVSAIQWHHESISVRLYVQRVIYVVDPEPRLAIGGNLVAIYELRQDISVVPGVGSQQDMFAIFTEI